MVDVAAAWLPVANDTEVRRCGGGRAPRGAGEVIVRSGRTL